MKKVGIALVCMGILIWLLSDLIFSANCQNFEGNSYAVESYFQESEDLSRRTYQINDGNVTQSAACYSLKDILMKISFCGILMIIGGSILILKTYSKK